MRLFCLRRRLPAVLILCLLLILLAGVPVSRAWAQTAEAATTIDLSPLVQWLLGLLSLGGTALAGMATTWLYAKLGIQKDSAAATAIQAAEQKAGALAYSFIASQGAKITDVKVRNQAIAAGANFMMDAVPNALGRLGISQASVLTRAEAELGKLLAGDPTVSVGSGPIAGVSTLVSSPDPVTAIFPKDVPATAAASLAKDAAAVTRALPIISGL